MIQGQINLVVSGTAAPNPVLAGGQLTYALTIANQGNIAARQVRLSDQLPAGVTLVSVTLSQGQVYSVSPSGQIGATLGTVAAGGTVTATIVVQTGANSVGTITDTATVSSQEADPFPADETVNITSTVLAASDLSMALGASPNPVLDGADVTFVMTVSNLGPDTANGVTATLPLGSGFDYVSASASVGTVSYTGGQVEFALDELDVSSTAIVTVVAQALTVGQLSATASVSSQAQDPNPANNTATVTVQVNPAADLAVTIARLKQSGRPDARILLQRECAQ